MFIKLNHFQHVGIPVTSIDRSKAFYERLGFSNAMETTFDHQGATGKVCMMKRDSMVFELYEFPEPTLSQIRERKDGPMDHIAFDVDSVADSFEWLKANGFQPLEEKPVELKFWDKGCKFCFIKGPDGERLEFCEIVK